jgi:pimeloyl-ACP methyl ester carboxylesterase
VQCLDLPVPLDPDKPTGTSLLLHVSVIRVPGGRAEPDPLVVLPPMAGEAASMAALSEAELRIHVTRDVVLVDQRGTGRSHALGCPTDDPEALLSGPQRTARWSRCSSQLDVDPRLFTTRAAVADLERARQALGYARWNLFGHGYGARVAMTYAQSYPQRVRSLVLENAGMPGDAAEANRAALGGAAVEATLTACAQVSDCAQAFPNLESETKQLVADLDRHPARGSSA